MDKKRNILGGGLAYKGVVDMNSQGGPGLQGMGHLVDADALAKTIQFQKEKGLTPYDAITAQNQLWEMGIKVVPRLENGEVVSIHIITIVDVFDRWIMSSVVQGTCFPQNAIDLLEEVARQRGLEKGHSLIVRPSLDAQFYNADFRAACDRLGITFEPWPEE